MPNINASVQWGEATCNDPNVGYSQTYRNQQTVNGITYYDCSSFVWYALLAGGFDCVTANGGATWPFVTQTMGTVLTNLGFQKIDRTGELKPGDICLNPQSHTEMVYEGGIGQARTMGAHSSNYTLPNQVSINSHYTSGTYWEEIWRYGSGGDEQVLYGVDISEHNGDINWPVAKDHVEFVIIRSGYGANHVDAKFQRNIDACVQYSIPFGIYWFSYATSVQDAVDEANYCCNLLTNYSLSYPVFYDWEYDSDDYYTQHVGQPATNNIRESFARAFMNTVLGNGYRAGLYSNKDYIGDDAIGYGGKGFHFILTESQYELWYAEWQVSQPYYTCQIWQYGQGQIPGFPTDVDLNKTTGISPHPPEPSDNDRFKWWIYLRFLPY